MALALGLGEILLENVERHAAAGVDVEGGRTGSSDVISCAAIIH